MAVGLVEFKVILFFGFLLEALLFGFVPIVLANKLSLETRDRFLGISNAFAAGLFLSAGFIHLLGETHDILSEQIPGTLPVALFLSSMGFLATFFFEKVFFANYHSHSHGAHESEKLHLVPGDDGGKYGTTPRDSTTDLPDPSTFTSSHPWVPYILMIVLSAHSVISGIAVGVQSTSDGIIPLAIAICTHKWIEAIAVGVSLVRMDLGKRRFFLLICIYALMEPLGVVGGSILTLFFPRDATLIIEGIAGAIASGTFIYVATIDVMMEEFSKARDKYLKMVFCIIGYALMTGLIFAVPHAHDEADPDDDKAQFVY